jgi:hypothetical protein
MTETTSIQAGETLFDVAIREYGHLQGVLNLIKDNGLGFTDEPAAGLALEVDRSASFDNLKSARISAVEETTDLPNEVTVQAGQNMFDIALQVYGDLSGIIELAKDNGKGLTKDLTAGEVLKSRSKLKNKPVADFFEGRKSKPATGLNQSESEQLKPEGIGYWAIGLDFIVS